jgi:hypothetical protein
MLGRDVEIISSAIANPNCCLIDTLSFLVKELRRPVPIDTWHRGAPEAMRSTNPSHIVPILK